MPLTGSALRRQKMNLRNRDRKRPLRSEARTRVRHAREAIAAGDLEAAARKVQHAVSHLDRAATRGALHRRNASRRKSRIQKALNRAAAQAQE